MQTLNVDSLRSIIRKEFQRQKKQQGLTQIELSKRIGITQSGLSKILCSNDDIKIGTAVKVLAAMQVDIYVEALPRKVMCS
jgi:transcriptional regulator with XRE-family HTH domain